MHRVPSHCDDHCKDDHDEDDEDDEYNIYDDDYGDDDYDDIRKDDICCSLDRHPSNSCKPTKIILIQMLLQVLDVLDQIRKLLKYAHLTLTIVLLWRTFDEIPVWSNLGKDANWKLKQTETVWWWGGNFQAAATDIEPFLWNPP